MNNGIGAGKWNLGRMKPVLVFLCISVLFVLCASDATSPLYPNTPVYELENVDQAMFSIMGRYWFEDGLLPYVGLFDHKGPIIFLLNGIGWSLTGNVHGIALLQIFFMLAYCLLAWYMVGCRHGQGYAYFSVIMSLFALRIVYANGNTLEEFGLPFQMLATLGLYLWSEQETVEHRPVWAFVYGVCAAYFVLNRASDALCVCLGCLIVVLSLIWAKAWRNILDNFVAGICGMAIVFLPFILYFSRYGAINEFFYGMIGHNIKYAVGKATSMLDDVHDIKYFIEILIYCGPILSCIGMSVLLALTGKRKKALLWVVISLGSAVFMYNSRFYDHYIINYVPLAVVTFSELCFEELKCRKLLYYTAVFSVTLVCVATVTLTERIIMNTWGAHKWAYVSEEKEYDALMILIPEDERDSVVLYNCPASVYMKYDIRPVYRYFTLQDWMGSMAEKVMGEIEAEFEEGSAQWVMTCAGTSEGVKAILESRYTEVAQEKDYKLYRIN